MGISNVHGNKFVWMNDFSIQFLFIKLLSKAVKNNTSVLFCRFVFTNYLVVKALFVFVKSSLKSQILHQSLLIFFDYFTCFTHGCIALTNIFVEKLGEFILHFGGKSFRILEYLFLLLFPFIDPFWSFTSENLCEISQKRCKNCTTIVIKKEFVLGFGRQINFFVFS